MDRLVRQARRTADLLQQGALPAQPGAMPQLAEVLGEPLHEPQQAPMFPNNQPRHRHRALHAHSPQELRSLAASADARHRRRLVPSKPRPRVHRTHHKAKANPRPKRKAKPAPPLQREIGLYDDPIEVDDSQPTCSAAAPSVGHVHIPATAVDDDTCSNHTAPFAPSCTDTVLYEPHGAQPLD
eukprot:3486184-Amphidinium_carterae.1